ncbi:hypothetical protein KP509_10G054900 [Ceratopteris richardii]|uniref:FYVE-type domain-containing protein n=1 Tax=Ceratopteris richardii TaxID=49495 RepID=A0A8T2TVG2_CERRI|nr:hypothetical protein KP509_10G054900 [Ceratopteris richardii]
MHPQAGQYPGSNLYAQAAPADASHPYAYASPYGSAPPYTPSSSYHADNSSQQSTIPQPTPYSTPSSSLLDSMASLSISNQGSFAPASMNNTPLQGSYVSPSPPVASSSNQASLPHPPPIPNYEQSYGPGPATGQQGFHLQYSTLSQSPGYDAGRFADNMPSPQISYDPLPPTQLGSYNSNPSALYEPPSVGSYGTSSQHVSASNSGYLTPASASGPMYNAPSSGTQMYGASQKGMPGYDYYSEYLGVFDQGGGAYGAIQQGGKYVGPTYSQGSGYDQGYYDKRVGDDRLPSKKVHDYDDLGLGEVYAYDGGNVEPYGARGTGTGGTWAAVDRFNSGNFDSYGSSGSSKLPKAVPKVEAEEKISGVQKYRVKMHSDASSSGPEDVLCQIGLDGVRMISPSTGKTVRIYPLETITRWEVHEPSVFTFWAKSSVDIEPRRIRLKSGSYTTNAILDTLTAACVQFSEMVGKMEPSKTSVDGDKTVDQNSEKKKNFVSWMQLKSKQLAPEEKQHWVPDEAVTKCSACGSDFGAFLRKHHCRNCGDIFCDKCTHGRTALTADEDAPVVRVCDRCLAEVTQRLSNAKERSSKPVPPPRNHEDLAKKLQEELERNFFKRSTTSNSSAGGKERSGPASVLNCNACGSISLVTEGTSRCPTCGVDSSSRSGRTRRDIGSSGSSWSTSDGSNKRVREVACPTCTVHLQVQVPSSGTETVECGVCQHPFLVSAH